MSLAQAPFPVRLALTSCLYLIIVHGETANTTTKLAFIGLWPFLEWTAAPQQGMPGGASSHSPSQRSAAGTSLTFFFHRQLMLSQHTRGKYWNWSAICSFSTRVYLPISRCDSDSQLSSKQRMLLMDQKDPVIQMLSLLGHLAWKMSTRNALLSLLSLCPFFCAY